MKTIKHANTYINVGSKGHFFLSTEKTSLNDFEFGYINTNVGFNNDYETNYSGLLVMPTNNFFIHKEFVERKNGFTNSYTNDTYPALIEEHVSLIDNLNVLTQKTSVTNVGSEPFTLNKLTAGNALGIGIDGSKWFEGNRYTVHYAVNRMQGEGQWQKKSMAELDLFPASTHPWEESIFRLQSLGSWCTGLYYPLIFIEDHEKGECWFFEREGGEAWFMEISVYAGYVGQFLNVSMGGCDEKTLWNKELLPGETYETTNCFYGVVKGGFEEAVKELLKYKRATNLTSADIIPTYNDFMCGLWCQQREDRNKALIDACHEVGVKRYVMDAGWSVTGTWEPLDEEIFPTMKLQGLIDYAKSLGIEFGVWFEFEKTSQEEYEYALSQGVTDFVLTKNGKVLSPHSLKLNMRSKWATDRLLEKIRKLYDMGVRYIKNDHNNEDRFGISMYNGESPSEGTRQNSLAYYEFIERVKKEFPDLVIEHCAAGGHRSDHGTLKHFAFQSSSDQEDYKLIPSIAQGILGYLAPEKLLLWSMPYPMVYNTHYNDLSLTDEEYKALSDGRETAFNMVNAMLGFIYLSGRPDLCDDFNKQLIREAFEVYMGYANTLKTRYPIFPVGTRPMSNLTFNAVGLQNENDTIMALWGLETTDFALDLTKYGFSEVEIIYPLSLNDASVCLSNNILTVSFNKKYSACLVKLK